VLPVGAGPVPLDEPIGMDFVPPVPAVSGMAYPEPFTRIVPNPASASGSPWVDGRLNGCDTATTTAGDGGRGSLAGSDPPSLFLSAILLSLSRFGAVWRWGGR